MKDKGSDLSLTEIEALLKMPLENGEDLAKFIKDVQILTKDKSQRSIEEFYNAIQDKSLKDFLSPMELKDIPQNIAEDINKPIKELIYEAAKQIFTEHPSVLKRALAKAGSIHDMTPREKAESLLDDLFFDNYELTKGLDPESSAGLYARIVADVAKNTGTNFDEIYDRYKLKISGLNPEDVKNIQDIYKTAEPMSMKEELGVPITAIMTKEEMSRLGINHPVPINKPSSLTQRGSNVTEEFLRTLPTSSSYPRQEIPVEVVHGGI